MTLDPIAVLFVLQTQEKGIPDNQEMSEEEEEKGVEERRERERGHERKHTTSNRRWGTNTTITTAIFPSATSICITDTRHGHPEQSGDVGAYGSTVCNTETRQGVPGQSGEGEEERRVAEGVGDAAAG